MVQFQTFHTNDLLYNEKYSIVKAIRFFYSLYLALIPLQTRK